MLYKTFFNSLQKNTFQLKIQPTDSHIINITQKLIRPVLKQGKVFLYLDKIRNFFVSHIKLLFIHLKTRKPPFSLVENWFKQFSP